MVPDNPADRDFPAHVETYRGFLRGAMMIIAAIAVLLVLMAKFLL